MRKPVFYSFHYARDAWRVQMVKNIGALEGQPLLSANDWQQVKRKGNAAIQAWIDDQLKYKHCTIVLVGNETATREWVLYEIKKSWNAGKGVVGVRIHGLENQDKQTDALGPNPFDLVDEVKWRATLHDPNGWDSQSRYNTIKTNLTSWVDQAIANRKLYP